MKFALPETTEPTENSSRPHIYLCVNYSFTIIVQTKTEQLFQLEITATGGRLCTVIKACMHKKLSRKITVQYKIESIFPLNAYPFIVSQIVQTGIDYNGRNNGP